MTLKEKYSDKAPLGVYPESNFGGLLVFESDDPEYDYVTAFDFGSGVKHVRHTNVRCDAKGEPFIQRFGRKYYLNTIMRADILYP